MPRRSLLALPLFLFLATGGFAWDVSSIDLEKVASGSTKLYKAGAGLIDADEIKLGRDVAANLAARYGLVDDPAKLKYLNLVGQAVALYSSRPTLPYHFGILHSQEFNAFAAPGGYIFVTEGLLAVLKDEAELAGVLAHEITHVTERHILKALRDANLFGAGQDLAAAVGQGPDAWTAMSDFTLNLLDKGFSRKDELQADRLGTQLAGSIGYDPRGLRDTIEHLTTLNGKDPLFARFNGTHPPATERLQALDKSSKKTAHPLPAVRLADRYAQAFSPSK